MAKLIQIYMGDRKAVKGMSLNSIALEIINLGQTQADELYVQMMRQASADNPSKDSVLRAFELIAICLEFFPPSHNLEPKLLDFLDGYYVPIPKTNPDFCSWPFDTQISNYAKVSMRRLERITGGKKSTKKPTEEDVNQARLQIYRDSMFGNTLEEVMALQTKQFPSHQLPWIQKTLSKLVIQMGGKQTEGIFRIPADLNEVIVVKNRVDQWEIPNVPGMDAHPAAGVLKLWYRELYKPLIPTEWYDRCLNTDDPNIAIKIVNSLPEINRLVLTYLINFLQEFADPSVVENTKMNVSNLAMVFAPNVLRGTSDDPFVNMANTQREMAFMRLLITHLDTKYVARLE